MKFVKTYEDGEVDVICYKPEILKKSEEELRSEGYLTNANLPQQPEDNEGIGYKLMFSTEKGFWYAAVEVDTSERDFAQVNKVMAELSEIGY